MKWRFINSAFEVETRERWSRDVFIRDYGAWRVDRVFGSYRISYPERPEEQDIEGDADTTVRRRKIKSHDSAGDLSAALFAILFPQ